MLPFVLPLAAFATGLSPAAGRLTFQTWRGAMNRLVRHGQLLVALSFFAVLLASSAGAQTVTTGAISGLVTDESGGVLPGATVEAVHEPKIGRAHV